MTKKILSKCVLCIGLLCFLGISQSWGEVYFTPPPQEQPSVFNYGWRGFGLGLLVGLAAGYVRYVDTSDSNENILKSVAIGGVAGAGFGVLLGIADEQKGQTGIGAAILHNMNQGGVLGLVVGTVWGGIEAIAQSQWQPLGEGAAWGYIGGVIVGLGVGIIEGPKMLQNSSRVARLKYEPLLITDSRARLCPGYRVRYSF